MMKRSAALEINRLGENAPRISCQKLPRPAVAMRLAATVVLAPIAPAAGFKGLTRVSYSLPDRMISTRRFLARPSAVALEASGLESP